MPPIERKGALGRASSMLDEARLVQAVRAGEAQALGTLYERHADAIYGIAFRILGSEQEAEDVLQDVFVGLQDALKAYDERGRFEPWLKRVTARAALMRMRRQQRLREDAIDHAEELPFDADRAGMLDRMAARDAITRLPDSLRVVFMLVEVEGYSHREVAQMLGVTVGASTARLFRAWRLVLAGAKGERT